MAEIELTQENFEQVMQSSLPVFVDFWASWCGPCKMMGPVVDKIAEEYDGRIIVCKCNVDENPQLCMTYDISGIPCLVLFKNGEIVDRSVGFKPFPAVSGWIESIIS